MAQAVDDTEVKLVAAALTGILAAHAGRKKPDYDLVCREAVTAGLRAAIGYKKTIRRAVIQKVRTKR
jgi:hypothetical protein